MHVQWSPCQIRLIVNFSISRKILQLQAVYYNNFRATPDCLQFSLKFITSMLCLGYKVKMQWPHEGKSCFYLENLLLTVPEIPSCAAHLYLSHVAWKYHNHTRKILKQKISEVVWLCLYLWWLLMILLCGLLACPLPVLLLHNCVYIFSCLYLNFKVGFK